MFSHENNIFHTNPNDNLKIDVTLKLFLAMQFSIIAWINFFLEGFFVLK